MSSRLKKTAGQVPPALNPLDLLETIQDAFYALDRDWRFVYVNRQAERLLDRSRSGLLGKVVWEEFPQAVNSTIYTQYHRAFETGNPVVFDIWYQPLQRWFEIRVSPAGLYLAVYFHDIGEHRKLHYATEPQHERLDVLLGSVDVGPWYCDLPFEKLMWSAKTKEHFHLSPEDDVYIDTFYERLHPEDRERTRQAIQTSIDRQIPYDTEYRTVSPAGEIKWIRAIGRAFYGSQGVPVRFDGVTVDISRQKALLAQEQVSRQEAEMLNRIGRALSAELDLEKLVQMITNAATELTHAQFGAFFYNVVAAEGESYTLYTIAGAPREAFSKFPMPRNTAVFGPTFHGEGVVRSGDITKDPRYGKNAPYNGMPAGHLPVRSYLAVPVVSRSGSVIGGLFFGHAEPDVFQDSHERIVVALASQAATAMDNAQLFNAAERAKQEAQNSAAALAKINAELQQVAYVAAHDLQEPLRTIASFTQLVDRRFRGAGGGAADDLVDGIVSAARRMQLLLNNLLEYTSLSSEEERPSGPVNLNEIAAECIEELSVPIRELNATVDIGDLPVIRPANRAQLKQCLINLLSNALKYAKPGVAPTVAVNAQIADGVCTVTVQDNGQGFAPEYSKQIFGMFKRLHGRDVPGTGIGLALCRRIVEVHGGSIWAESKPGEGAAIHFTLPCRTTPQ